MIRALQAQSLLLLLYGCISYRATGSPVGFILLGCGLALTGWVIRSQPTTAYRWWIPASLVIGLIVLYHHGGSYLHPSVSLMLAFNLAWGLATQSYLLQQRACAKLESRLQGATGHARVIDRGGRLQGATPFFFGSVLGAIFLLWHELVSFSKPSSLLLALAVLVIAGIVWEHARTPAREEGVRVRGMTTLPPGVRAMRWGALLLMLGFAWFAFTKAIPPLAEELSFLVPEKERDSEGPEKDESTGPGGTPSPPPDPDSTTADGDYDFDTAEVSDLEMTPAKLPWWWAVRQWIEDNAIYVFAALAALVIAWFVWRQRKRAARRSAGGSDGDGDGEDVEIELSGIRQPKYLQELCELGERLGLPRRLGDTVKEYVGRLRQAGLIENEFDELADYYNEVRYGGARIDRKRERGIWSAIQAFGKSRKLR